MQHKTSGFLAGIVVGGRQMLKTIAEDIQNRIDASNSDTEKDALQLVVDDLNEAINVSDEEIVEDLRHAAQN